MVAAATQHLEEVADERRAMSIVAAMFGFAVLAATAPEPVARAQVRTYVRSILGGAT
jgi:hypothetical protein